MRLQPQEDSDANIDTSDIRIKKSYLQKISKGGLKNIELLLPYIDNLVPISLDTSEKSPVSLNRIVYKRFFEDSVVLGYAKEKTHLKQFILIFFHSLIIY